MFLIIFLIAWYIGWIFAWVYGTEKRIHTLVFLGSFFTLFIFGLIIALIQTTNRRISESNNMQAQFIEMQNKAWDGEASARKRKPY